MSLSSMLRSRCTLQRQTTTKDASGGPVQSWASVPGSVDVACDVQPTGGRVTGRFLEDANVVTHKILVERDLDARASDRITVGARTFLVVAGGYTPPAPGYDQWPGSVDVQEVPHTP